MKWLALAALAFIVGDWLVTVPLKILVWTVGSVTLAVYLFLSYIAHQLQADESAEREEG